MKIELTVLEGEPKPLHTEVAFMQMNNLIKNQYSIYLVNFNNVCDNS